jgi:hypothetical protein
MRILGRAYIEHEFREHYGKASSVQMGQFVSAWDDYIRVVDRIERGECCEDDSNSGFTREQVKRMELLERTINPPIIDSDGNNNNNK